MNNLHSNHDDMRGCDHPANTLLEAVAFGWATPEERAIVTEHVSHCPVCRATLEMLQSSTDALLLSAPEPPVTFKEAEVWNRIQQTTRHDNESSISPVQGIGEEDRRDASFGKWSGRQLMAIAALALISLVAGLLIGRTYFPESEAPQPQNITIQFADPDISATGTLRYLPDEQVYVLEMENMPELPEGQVYQVWLIGDDTPQSAGVMNSASGEFATAGSPEEFQTLAITVERGPTGVDAPTTDPVMTADLKS